MEMSIDFPGGGRVDAAFCGFTVHTDQEKSDGGQGEWPAPFDYFLASLGTCAGHYIQSFLKARNLPTEGVRVVLKSNKDDKSKLLSEVEIRVRLPEGFPQKYRGAIARAVNQCTVKRTLESPPEFKTVVE